MSKLADNLRLAAEFAETHSIDGEHFFFTITQGAVRLVGYSWTVKSREQRLSVARRFQSSNWRRIGEGRTVGWHSTDPATGIEMELPAMEDLPDRQVDMGIVKFPEKTPDGWNDSSFPIRQKPLPTRSL